MAAQHHKNKNRKQQNAKLQRNTENRKQERRHTTHTGELQKARTRVAVDIEIEIDGNKPDMRRYELTRREEHYDRTPPRRRS